jgi:hypothetical protein
MYYLRAKACDHCGQRPEDLPIGLSAIGWRFLWRGYRADGQAGEELTSPLEWFAFLGKRTGVGDVIVDEYECGHSLEQFRSFVEGKRRVSAADRQSDAQRVGEDDISFEAFS